MYSINVAFYAENAKTAAVNFAAHLMAMGNSSLATKIDVKDGEEEGSVEMLFAVGDPTKLFKLFEEYASESIPVPENLRDIYFHEMIYSLHTVPTDVDLEQMAVLINHCINFTCVVRRDNYRLRNMFLSEADDGFANPVAASSLKSIQDAVNILSKKVLGTELLTTINNKEEMKWPVH